MVELFTCVCNQFILQNPDHLCSVYNPNDIGNETTLYGGVNTVTWVLYQMIDIML